MDKIEIAYYHALITRNAPVIARFKYIITVRADYTSYRGKILLCSSGKNAQTIALANLLDCKPVVELKDWERSACINIPEKGYAWVISEAQRVVEYPIRAKKGFRKIAFNQDEIIPYPHFVALDYLPKPKKF